MSDDSVRADPKPAPRAKRTPKPLRRRVARPNRAAKKKLRPTRFCASPEHPRCYKQPVHFGMCGECANEHLDNLLRRIVVPHEFVACEAADWHASLFACAGPIQPNHVIDRQYLMTKWWLPNLLPGCAKLNQWAHYNRPRWYRMFRDWRGELAYRALEDIAFSGAKLDWDATHADLHARLGEQVEQMPEAA